MPEKTLAMYIRLSVEDGDLRASQEKSESNSVTNQRKILQSYRDQYSSWGDPVHSCEGFISLWP